MSEQGTRPEEDAWPPEWVDADEETRHAWSNLTVFGAATVAAWRAAPGAAPFDRSLALRPGDAFPVALPEASAARATALATARQRRPAHMTEAEWERILDSLWDGLTEEQRRSADDIVRLVARRDALDQQARRRRQALDDLVKERAITGSTDHLDARAAALLEPRGRGRPGWTNRQFREHWQQAYREAKARLRREPTVIDVEGHFRALNGATFLDPSHVRALRRRHETGQLSE